MKKSVVLTVFLAIIAIQPVQAKWGVERIAWAF